MGQNQFAGNVLQILLSWFQSLINGVWSLFSGGGGGSVLRWFSQNWLSLLAILMIIGVSANMLVYLFRWRPFWWWFRKKRLIIDDELFDDEPPRRIIPAARNSPENKQRPVKPSTIVPRRTPQNGKMNDDIFMTDSLFDVSGATKKRKTENDKLYAKTPVKKSPAPRR